MPASFSSRQGQSLRAAVAPAAPASLVVTGHTEASVSLQWQDLSDDEDGFRVDYRRGTGAWTVGATVAANEPAGHATNYGTAQAANQAAFEGFAHALGLGGRYRGGGSGGGLGLREAVQQQHQGQKKSEG